MAMAPAAFYRAIGQPFKPIKDESLARRALIEKV
jgi:hypothetical protein